MASSKRLPLSGRLAGVEAGLIFGCIMAYIWWLRYYWPRCWMVILAAIIVSHVLHSETPAYLGFGWKSTQRSFGRIAPVVFGLSGLLLALGLMLHTIRKIPWWGALLNLAVYIPWGLFQQYLLNGYFVNRLRSALTDGTRTAGTAAMLFAAAHLPNWLLMAITLAGGYLAARFYLKERNLYVLGVAHGVLGFMVYLVVPDWVSHHLYVGPKWFPR